MVGRGRRSDGDDDETDRPMDIPPTLMYYFDLPHPRTQLGQQPLARKQPLSITIAPFSSVSAEDQKEEGSVPNHPCLALPAAAIEVTPRPW